MDYKEIEKAIADIKPVDIKGKPYIEVNQRIKIFRRCYPEGSIVTKIVKLDGGVCLMKATVYDQGRVVAVGHAYEKEGSTFINKTSYIENAETSAVGRALGMLGIGVDASIASAEEVQNAINNQNNIPQDLPDDAKDKLKDTISKKDAEILVELAMTMGWGANKQEASAKLLDHFGVSALSEITNAQKALFVKEQAGSKQEASQQGEIKIS